MWRKVLSVVRKFLGLRGVCREWQQQDKSPMMVGDDAEAGESEELVKNLEIIRSNIDIYTRCYSNVSIGFGSISVWAKVVERLTVRETMPSLESRC